MGRPATSRRVALRRLAGVTAPLRRTLPALITSLALAVAVLPAASPYLFGDGLPRTNDALQHLYRVVALDKMVRAGQLWPRWSPDLVHGYGYPVFNFFPALSHWLVELFHLAGLPLTTAYRATVFAHFWLAAAGSYALGRAWFGPASGWAAALAYSYSPYLLYDAHVRGGLPESQALALLPWLLLALWQAASGRQRWVAGSGLFFAALILSHHPVAYQLTLPVAFWLLATSRRRGWRWLARPFAGLALGGLLAAFFWLPALAEIGYTRAALSISQGYGYQQNFLSLRQMVAWPNVPADPALINPPVVRQLPLVALAAVACGLVWGYRRPGAWRRRLAVWLALLVISVWLVTPSSQLVWAYLPMLEVTLYPWRYLGMASMAAALLLAIAVSGRTPIASRRGLVLPVVTALLVAGAVPWLYPPREPAGENPGVAELNSFEIPPLFIGTTTLGEFLPRWVEALPDGTNLLPEQAASGNAERLHAAGDVATRRLGGPVWNAAYHLEAGQATTVTYRQFYFPGWRATLDGRPLAVRPSRPHGLLELTVPAGAHTLEITFGSTTPRRLGWLLTLAGAAGMILALARPRREHRLPENGPPALSEPAGANRQLLLAGLAVAVWLFFTLVDTPLRRPALRPDGLAGRSAFTPVDFAGEVQLLGIDRPQRPLAADQPVPVIFYLRPLRPIGVPYVFGVQIVDANGLVWSERSERPSDWRFIGGAATWPLDGYRMEPFVLTLLDGTPPGTYAFNVGLVRQDTGQTVAAHTVAEVALGEPGRGDRPLEAGMTAQQNGRGHGLNLLGTRLDRRQARPGDPVRLTLLWQVADPAAAPAGPVTLSLVATPGARPLLVRTAPVAAGYPPSRWQSGDRLRTELVTHLPANIAAGRYTWQAVLSTAQGDAAAWPVGTLEVSLPERLWSPPALDVELGVRLGGVATLLGANVEPQRLVPGSAVIVTLAWRAEAETNASYRVFLHLVAPNGALVVQSDGEPADWSRPTTGWLPGEVVLDERRLALPADLAAGSYRLVAGLYDLASGVRLAGPDGQTAVTVARLELER